MNSPKILKTAIRDVEWGERVTVIEPANIYECSIGDDCFVGPFVEIQRGVVVGPRTRVQSHAFICSQVVIGADCFVSHGVMFINDLMNNGRPNRDPDGWIPTNVGNRVVIGTNATILPVRICDDVLIGAGAVVNKDIEHSGVYVGNPARFLRPL